MAQFTSSQVNGARYHLREATDMAAAAYWRETDSGKDFNQQEMLVQIGKALRELGYTMVPVEQPTPTPVPEYIEMIQREAIQ